jgi:hypothetical protein
MRTKGMLQDLHKQLEGDMVRAERLLSSLEGLMHGVIGRLLGSHSSSKARSGAFARFRNGLKALAVGLGPLQISNLVVNMSAFGLFDELLPSGDAYDELVFGEWPGVGEGSAKSLRMCGFSTALELREAVLRSHPELEARYGTDITTVENVPCETHRALTEVLTELLEWKRSQAY